MTERERFDVATVKRRIIAEQGGLCGYTDSLGNRCTQPATELAHRIPQTKWALRKYGAEVIHHRLNLVATCHKHNAAMMRGVKGEMERRLVELIREDLAAKKTEI